MKYIATLIFGLTLCLAPTASAQQHLLNSVKTKINTLTLTSDVYKSAISTLKPALTNEETKDLAETWYLEGKLQYGYYDKMMDARTVGKKVEIKEMGRSLIAGYEAFVKALPLDTVIMIDKKGNAKIDKKTGKVKFKTKYSSEMVDKIAQHQEDFNIMGGELYNIKDWEGAFKAWEIYCSAIGRKTMADSVMGQTRSYQAWALWPQGDNRQAVNYFAQARRLGYVKKEVYDYALVCLSALDDDDMIIELAGEAYERFGVSDSQYARILIKDHINNKNLEKASVILDKIIAVNDSDAEIFNLKGLVVEQQKGMSDALPYYKKCLELSPENAQGLFNVGRYYYNEAASVTEKYPRLTGRKLAAKTKPLYREAMPYLEKAYALDPTNCEAKNALRNIYYKLGEAKKLQQIEKE